MTVRVVVAIPARADEPTLVPTVEAFDAHLRVLEGIDGRIAVCVNGAPVGTSPLVGPLQARGVEVHELEVASKPAAWNLLRSLPADVTIFADADVLPEPGSVAALVAALVDDPALVAATAGQRPDRPTTIAGRVAAIPFALDFGGLAGTLYALRTSEAPESMPTVLLDDAWLYGTLVAAHGEASVRRVEGAAARFTLASSWRDVWRQRVRAEGGKRQLATMGVALAPPPAGRSAGGVLSAYAPAQLPFVGALAAVKVAAALRARLGPVTWAQATSTKPAAALGSRPPCGPADVVFVNHRSGPLLATALDALAAQEGVSEVFVIDNASDDGSADAARGRDGVTLVRNADNVGFAAAVNQALQLSTAASVLLLNADVELGAGYVERLVDALDANQDAASATGLLVLPDGRVDSTGISLTVAAWGSDRDRHADALSVLGHGDPFGVSGAAGLFRRADLDAVGPLWEALFVYGEDVELAWRLRRAGRRALFVPAATAVHQRGSDSADPTFVEAASYGSRVATLARHRGVLGLLDPRTLLVTVVVTARLALRHPAALRRAAPLAKVRAGLSSRAAGPSVRLSPHPWRAWLRAQLGR